MASADDQLPNILDNQVSITNIAARAAQGFTLREKRVVMAGISMIDSRKSKSDHMDLKARTIKVHAKDYAAIAQIDEKSAYKELMQAGEHLFNRYLRYNVITPKGVQERKLRWIEALEYHHGLGYVEFSFTTSILPHLCELNQKYFTKYRLEQASGLRSIYSWRLMELLTSHNDGKDGTKPRVKTITIDELRLVMEIPDSYRYDDIKRQVITKGVDELIQKDHWGIQWRPIKTGRSVTAIEFTFSRDPQKMIKDDNIQQNHETEL